MKKKEIILIVILFLLVVFISAGACLLMASGLLGRSQAGFDEKPICIDSDGGTDSIFVKGYIIELDKEGNEIRTYDECSESKLRVNEAWCSLGANYVSGRFPFDCPNGCSDGACLREKNVTIASRSFSHPYPVQFDSSYGKWSLALSVTGISLSERVNPPIGSEGTNLLSLGLKVRITGDKGSTYCFPKNFRLVLNEEGDLKAPIDANQSMCLSPNQTYEDQVIAFSVPESQREFTITTGNPENILFIVKVDEDNQVDVEL